MRRHRIKKAETQRGQFRQRFRAGNDHLLKSFAATFGGGGGGVADLPRLVGFERIRFLEGGGEGGGDVARALYAQSHGDGLAHVQLARAHVHGKFVLPHRAGKIGRAVGGGERAHDNIGRGRVHGNRRGAGAAEWIKEAAERIIAPAVLWIHHAHAQRGFQVERASSQRPRPRAETAQVIDLPTDFFADHLQLFKVAQHKTGFREAAKQVDIARQLDARQGIDGQHHIEHLVNEGLLLGQDQAGKQHFLRRVGVAARASAYFDGHGGDVNLLAIEIQMIRPNGVGTRFLREQVIGERHARATRAELHLLSGARHLQAGDGRKFHVGRGTHAVEGEGGLGALAQIEQARLDVKRHLRGTRR
ncbi:MAG: hypothetical protein BWX54_02414 [Verrucomicrobia bacterium ADurb.Bin018]|nr:MAG: hypothetical protein BWX54_02414 [Verrucomicrobia bacterium ADurb.Bin018]